MPAFRENLKSQASASAGVGLKGIWAGGFKQQTHAEKLTQNPGDRLGSPWRPAVGSPTTLQSLSTTWTWGALEETAALEMSFQCRARLPGKRREGSADTAQGAVYTRRTGTREPHKGDYKGSALQTVTDQRTRKINKDLDSVKAAMCTRVT